MKLMDAVVIICLVSVRLLGGKIWRSRVFSNTFFSLCWTFRPLVCRQASPVSRRRLLQKKGMALMALTRPPDLDVSRAKASRMRVGRALVKKRKFCLQRSRVLNAFLTRFFFFARNFFDFGFVGHIKHNSLPYKRSPLLSCIQIGNPVETQQPFLVSSKEIIRS